jgi:hypothetical protein
MIIKLTLTGLILLLVLVIAASYYNNKEGFEDIFKDVSPDLTNAIKTVDTELEVSIDNKSSDSSKSSDSDAQSTTQQSTTPQSTTPQRNDIVPEVKISGTGYDAMTLQQKSELLKDIQKVVRNEILANRSTTPLTKDKYENEDTTSSRQGKEYEESCYKDSEYRCPKNPDGTCPPVPDMSQYIKKDAIPCYGCSLDY